MKCNCRNEKEFDAKICNQAFEEAQVGGAWL